MAQDLKIEQSTKQANTNYPIHDLISDRWSPRVFSDTIPSEQELRQLFEAARWSASSNNLQPWRFIITHKGSESYDKAFDCLSDFNQSWVKSPILVLAGFHKMNPNGQENFHALYDLGLAVGNMSAQAQSMGIALHQMAGLNWRKAHEVFNVPEGYHLATAIAIGFYGGDPSALPKDLEKAELAKRTRNPQSEFVFKENWNTTF